MVFFFLKNIYSQLDLKCYCINNLLIIASSVSFSFILNCIEIISTIEFAAQCRVGLTRNTLLSAIRDGYAEELDVTLHHLFVDFQQACGCIHVR